MDWNWFQNLFSKAASEHAPATSAVLLSGCPYNKPVLLEGMLPWLWNGGRERNPEKLAGHRGKLLSSHKEVVQDCVSLVSPWPLQTNCPTSGAAQLCPAARHRAVLQWHTLPSTYICIIKKTQPTQNQNTAFPPRLTPFFYFLWMTKKITLCTQARNMVCKKK